jgi:hypothetical protein
MPIQSSFDKHLSLHLASESAITADDLNFEKKIPVVEANIQQVRDLEFIGTGMCEDRHDMWGSNRWMDCADSLAKCKDKCLSKEDCIGISYESIPGTDKRTKDLCKEGEGKCMIFNVGDGDTPIDHSSDSYNEYECFRIIIDIWDDEKKYKRTNDTDFNGSNLYKWEDGTEYDGQWKNGEKHGQGIQHYANGAQYVGQWENGERHGYGKQYYSNGAKYVGGWENGKRHGYGVQIYIYHGGLSTATYTGYFKDGARDGQGVYEYNWCDCYYDGEFKEGARNGFGIIYSEGSEVMKGIWDFGRCKKPQCKRL